MSDLVEDYKIQESQYVLYNVVLSLKQKYINFSDKDVDIEVSNLLNILEEKLNANNRNLEIKNTDLIERITYEFEK